MQQQQRNYLPVVLVPSAYPGMFQAQVLRCLNSSDSEQSTTFVFSQYVHPPVPDYNSAPPYTPEPPPPPPPPPPIRRSNSFTSAPLVNDAYARPRSQSTSFQNASYEATPASGGVGSGFSRQRSGSTSSSHNPADAYDHIPSDRQRSRSTSHHPADGYDHLNFDRQQSGSSSGSSHAPPGQQSTGRARSNSTSAVNATSSSISAPSAAPVRPRGSGSRPPPLPPVTYLTSSADADEVAAWLGMHDFDPHGGPSFMIPDEAPPEYQ
jgi:hypothetical protein